MNFPIGTEVVFTPTSGKERNGKVVALSDVGARKVLLDGDPFPVKLKTSQLRSCNHSESPVRSSGTAQAQSEPARSTKGSAVAPEISAKQLTSEARNLGIPGWQDMTRPQLEAAVAKEKGKKEKKGKKAKAGKPTKGEVVSPETTKPAKASKSEAPKKAAPKPAAKKASAPKKAAPKKSAAPKKAAAKAPAKKAAPKKSAAKKAPAKKTAPTKAKSSKKSEPGSNPFRKGSNIYTIFDLLIKGGKRRVLAERLQRKIGDLHPYGKGKKVTLADYDKRIILAAQECARYGFRETRTGRGLDGTIKIEYVGTKRSTKRIKK